MLAVDPPRGWQLVDVRELWQSRELVYFLIWRDVKVRYKQTLLGAAWAVLQPAMMMVVFSIFFGRMAGVSSGNLPYPIFVYCGLLPWQLFAYALTPSFDEFLEVQSELLLKMLDAVERSGTGLAVPVRELVGSSRGVREDASAPSSTDGRSG